MVFIIFVPLQSENAINFLSTFILISSVTSEALHFGVFKSSPEHFYVSKNNPHRWWYYFSSPWQDPKFYSFPAWVCELPVMPATFLIGHATSDVWCFTFPWCSLYETPRMKREVLRDQCFLPSPDWSLIWYSCQWPSSDQTC